MIIAARQSMMTGKKPSEEKWWLCFTAEQAWSTIQMEHFGTGAPSISLETSVDDGDSWQSFTVDSTKITLSNIGDKVYFRAVPNGNERISVSTGKENNFIMSGKISASGNLHSLLNANEVVSTIPSACYTYLFYNCKSLIAAEVPNANRFERKCYQYMFTGCSNLSTITVHFTSFADAAGDVNTYSWLTNTNSTTSLGTFYCPAELGTQETMQRGSQYCPTKWTVVNI